MRTVKLFGFREKLFVSALFFIILASLGFWIFYIYTNATNQIPARGGDYAEGIVGQPRYVNPLLSQSSEADAALTGLIYNGLLRYDGEGKLANDLAESYEISEDKMTYTFHLKNDLFWHDGEKLTAEDVYFTFNIVQDPAYKSPLRQAWQGVEMKKIDENTISFSLKNPYFGFLGNLTTGILPKHIWKDVFPEQFALSDHNVRPVGSGPYYFVDFQKNSAGNIIFYELSAFEKYSGGRPFISKMSLNFYPDEDSLLDFYNKKEIKGMENILAEKKDLIKNKKSTKIYELLTPNYFGVFMNQTKSVPLASDEVREALALSVDRNEIINEVLGGSGMKIYSPFISGMKEYDDGVEKYSLDTERAIRILEEKGWKYNEEEKVREKNGTKLQFKIDTIDWPELARTADILVRQWEKIGAKVEVNVVGVSDLRQNYIRPREYEMILYGQISSFNPDPYSFWHSTQTKDPGLNLSLFSNDKADELLKSAREELDEGKRTETYREFQKILAKEIPAIFLYSSHYLYPVNTSIKGITAKNINSYSGRFADVNKWYIKTKRVKK